VPERALVYIHTHAPPTAGGTPVLLHRLLSGPALPPLHVLTDRKLRTRLSCDGEHVLPGRYHFFLRKGPRGNRWCVGRTINGVVNLALAVIAGIQGAWLVHRARAGWVLSVADEGFSPLAGSIAARIAGRPHLLMVFDLWEENAYTEFERAVAHALERRLFSGANRVIVHCREMAEHYREKYGISCVILPTSVEPPESSTPPLGIGAERSEVLYAGAVYWAQEDALRRLSGVVARLDDVALTIVGSWSNRDALVRKGIATDQLEPDLPPVIFRRRLTRADVLFLGLGFGTPYPDVVRTASPAKLPEYMAAGRPILVHAPAGSHVAEYAREADFAEVVDIADETALERGLLRILGNPELSSRRAARALELARGRHAAASVRSAFTALLDGVLEAG